MDAENNSLLKKAFTATIPVMAGYIVLGMGFGIILKSKGYSVIWAALMSIFIYAGSMQFTAINLFTGGASYITVAITTLVVNARHLLYGLSMTEQYKKAGPVKPYLIFSLTDETYSLVCDPNKLPKDSKKSVKYCFYVSLLNQIYWITGSVLGALLKGAISFDTTGIDFALTALFITIVVDQWRSEKKHFGAIIGFLASFFCLVIFGKDNFLIPSMLVIVATMLVKIKMEAKNGEQ